MSGSIDDPSPGMHDTTAANRARQDFSGVESVWLFGYGSLIYKVDFPYLERRPARIHGWSRRFWQGSHDHRGTLRQPGRVATLVPEAGAVCVGMAYRVMPETFELLDFREKNGYLRSKATLHFADGQAVDGLVYIATIDNAAWLGPADDVAIARHIVGSAGPSGSNADYVFDLAAALRELGADDRHVFAVETHLRNLHEAGWPPRPPAQD
jgi:glutathione-specific gamma-glutamylcyclotransferase